MRNKKKILAPLTIAALLAVPMNVAFANDNINGLLNGKAQETAVEAGAVTRLVLNSPIYKVGTPLDALTLVEDLDPGNFSATHYPEYDLFTEDGSFYYYIGYSAAFGMGGDVFVEQGTGRMFAVNFESGTETDPNAPFPDFSIPLN
jgi:hypothetical protein